MSKSITARLIAVQSALRAPKSQFNSFGKYKYRNCEDILEAVKPLLQENELSLFLSDEVVLIGERYYVKVTCTLTCADSGEQVSTTAYSREELDKKGMDQSQITGASSSYARKYALNGLFLIDDTKDSDTTNQHGKGEDSKPTAPEAPKKAAAKESPKAAAEDLTDRYKKAIAFIDKSKDKATAVKQALDAIRRDQIPFTEEQINNLKKLAEVIQAESVEVIPAGK